MEGEHSREVDVADDVNVVQDEWLVGIFEEPGGLFQSATGVEQNVFARDCDLDAEIIVGGEVVDEAVGEVMRVNDYFVDAEGL